MTRTDAENTFRDVATQLISIEQRQFPSMHARLHGATLLVTQTLAMSQWMNEEDALAALARAAELAAERLLLRNLEIPDPRCAALVDGLGSELLALAHQHALRGLLESYLSSSSSQQAAQNDVRISPK